MFVKLIASDGHEFVIKREYALASPTIEAMLSGPGQFEENETAEIRFKEIPSHILAKVCEYLQYKVHYKESSIEERPRFPVAKEISLELLMAAIFFQI